MFALSQNRISSLRGYVFCFAPESGHRALQSACLFRANYGSRRLFDHLIGAAEQHRWHFEAKRFGGLEVDDQLEFGLLVNGEFSRISALENLRNLACGTAPKVPKIERVGHQPAEFDVLTKRIDCRNPG